MTCKAEGISATLEDGVVNLFLVTDADDRGAPALLLAATLASDHSTTAPTANPADAAGVRIASQTPGAMR
jgi:hypothetical protein